MDWVKGRLIDSGGSPALELARGLDLTRESLPRSCAETALEVLQLSDDLGESNENPGNRVGGPYCGETSSGSGSRVGVEFRFSRERVRSEEERANAPLESGAYTGASTGLTQSLAM
jgi:hypothetical protein